MRFGNACPKCNSTYVRYNKIKKEWRCIDCHTTITPIIRQIKTPQGIRKVKPNKIPVPTCQEMTQRINQIPILEHRALFSTLYLTGSRVSEITGQPKKGIPPLKRNQLRIDKDTNQRTAILIENLTVLKTRTDTQRIAPIILQSHKTLSKHIMLHAQTKKLDEPLFTYSRKTVWALVKKYFPQNWYPHFFRHSFVTYTIRELGLSLEEVRVLIGWKDLRSLQSYAHLQWKDVARKL